MNPTTVSDDAIVESGVRSARRRQVDDARRRQGQPALHGGRRVSQNRAASNRKVAASLRAEGKMTVPRLPWRRRRGTIITTTEVAAPPQRVSRALTNGRDTREFEKHPCATRLHRLKRVGIR